VTAALDFRLPPALEASAPPEERGLPRDAVRLMVARGGAPLRHGTFRDLAAHLRPGDLVVVNESATIPAAVEAEREDGDRVQLHFSTPDPDGPGWLVELRRDGFRVVDGRAGEVLALPGGAAATLAGAEAPAPRLWRAGLDLGGRTVLEYLAGHGAPIRYAHDLTERPLAAYQTLFSRVPGSAEMPSAGRPFTPRVLHGLAARGVGVARLTLHTGVSSLEVGELPYAERFAVPPTTAAAVNATRRAGRRVIAVGTTVTRALESAAAPDGTVRPASGWTDLTITSERGVRAVDGLLTGWHEPEASHLLLLEAVAGRPLVERSYAAAVALGYRWHEFGDTHLLLP
jgi:S-adenosylmethionine:tRNA ribosyltransferase-isomerase